MLESEIINDYKYSIRFAIIDHILLDPAERIRLFVDKIPLSYPVLHIRAPMPWHQSIITSTHYNHHHLFIGNEILRNIRDLWHAK